LDYIIINWLRFAIVGMSVISDNELFDKGKSLVDPLNFSIFSSVPQRNFDIVEEVRVQAASWDTKVEVNSCKYPA